MSDEHTIKEREPDRPVVRQRRVLWKGKSAIYHYSPVCAPHGSQVINADDDLMFELNEKELFCKRCVTRW